MPISDHRLPPAFSSLTAFTASGERTSWSAWGPKTAIRTSPVAESIPAGPEKDTPSSPTRAYGTGAIFWGVVSETGAADGGADFGSDCRAAGSIDAGRYSIVPLCTRARYIGAIFLLLVSKTMCPVTPSYS